MADNKNVKTDEELRQATHTLVTKIANFYDAAGLPGWFASNPRWTETNAKFQLDKHPLDMKELTLGSRGITEQLENIFKQSGVTLDGSTIVTEGQTAKNIQALGKAIDKATAILKGPKAQADTFNLATEALDKDTEHRNADKAKWIRDFLDAIIMDGHYKGELVKKSHKTVAMAGGGKAPEFP